MSRSRRVFSWAEFMAEEPVTSKRCKRKPKPATRSMFEWVLSIEQEAGERVGRRGILGCQTHRGRDASFQRPSPCANVCSPFLSSPGPRVQSG